MFGLFKKNEESSTAQLQLIQSELEVAIQEIVALKEKIKEKERFFEEQTKFQQAKEGTLFAEKQRLAEQVMRLTAEKEALAQELGAKPNEEQSAQLGAIEEQLKTLQAQKDQLQAEFTALQQDRSEIVKNRQFLWEEYQKLDVSRNEWRERCETLEAERNSWTQSSSSLAPTETTDVEKILEDDRKLRIQLENLDQENNFLLIQIRQNQDALEKYARENQALKDFNHSLQAKWQRLEKRFPNYVDYGGLEIISVDGVAAQPKIIWKITDYSRAGFALPEFYFETILQNGQLGIALVEKESATQRCLFPTLLTGDPQQRELFLDLSLSSWQKIKAASDVLGQLVIDQGAALAGGQSFDLSFWKVAISSMVQAIQKLPNTLRFEQVKLKRELVNPNYEHLWLEFYDLTLDVYHVPKFEMRLAAALVDAQNFSRFPKIEIPLIDGKDKPFESWYPESYDDQGSKLELRFSLEKQVFDVTVFAKLNPVDQRLMTSLIYRLPAILDRLSQNKISIHRPWSDWSNFAKATVAVMQNQLAQLRSNSATQEAAAVTTESAGIVTSKKGISVVRVGSKAKTETSPKKPGAVKKRKTA